MAADREVIQEFLATLGFRVEPVSTRRFFDAMANGVRQAGKLGAVIIAVAAASEVMVKKFASGMEGLYYSSQRTKSSVRNIQSLKFAFEQVGLSADDAEGAIESVAHALRNQPGLKALLKGFGIDGNKDPADIVLDLVKRLSKMPHFVGARWAEEFGISEKAFLHLKNNIVEVEEAYRKRQEMAPGANVQQWAKDSKEYMNILRELWERIEVMSQGVASRLLPAFRSFQGVVNEILKDFEKWTSTGSFKDLLNLDAWLPQIHSIVTELGRLYDILNRLISIPFGNNWGSKLFDSMKNLLKNSSHAFLNFVDGVLAIASGNFSKAREKFSDVARYYSSNPFVARDSAGKVIAPSSPASPALPPASGNQPNSLFGQLENQYGLPVGLLDRVWSKESNRGQNMLSPAGARGHFQFMPDTARRFGIYGQEGDLTASATAASKYLKWLLDRYGGDLHKALAGYNWGEGNVDRFGIDSPRLPRETADYIATIAGPRNGPAVDARRPTVQQNNTFHIQGSNPREIGAEVGRVMGQANIDLSRNFVGATR